MSTFDEIIQFAINREKEAVAFYQELQAIARFQPQKEVLREFEMMEMGHVRLLEGVSKRHSLEKLKTAVPEDLKLNEYLVETPATAEMSYQDILITAIKKEDRAVELYTKLSTEASGPEVKKVFDQLVIEELKHKHHFELIYDKDILKEN